MTQHSAPRPYHVVLLVLMALLPALTAIVLLRASFQANFTDLVPIWTDEVYYWHQAQSFREAGFSGGYYTVNEIAAPADFSHFYAWGPMIPVVYGAIGTFTGWNINTMPLVNLALLTLTMFVVLWQVRTDVKNLLFIGFAVSAFSPLLMNGIASGIVTLECILALLAAAGFYRVLLERENTPRAWWLTVLIFLLWASTIRLTWGVMVLPLLVLVAPKTLLRQTGALLVSGVLIVLCAAWYQSTSAPFPYAFGEMLATTRVDFSQALSQWAALIDLNLSRFNQGDWLERHMRWLTVASIIVLMLTGIFVFVRRKSLKNAPGWLWEIGFHLFNLGSVLAFNVFVYDMAEWRDYRQFAPRILLSLIVLILCRRRWLAVALTVAMLVSLPAMKTVYDIWTGYHLDPVRAAEYPDWQAKLESALIYDPDAPSAWCNTVLHSALYGWSQVPMLMSVDGRMGLSSPLEEAPNLPFKSRYLMLDNAYYATIADRVPDLERLVELPDGWLYRNPAANCND